MNIYAVFIIFAGIYFAVYPKRQGCLTLYYIGIP